MELFKKIEWNLVDLEYFGLHEVARGIQRGTINERTNHGEQIQHNWSNLRQLIDVNFSGESGEVERGI